jgi:hypothetical protein
MQHSSVFPVVDMVAKDRLRASGRSPLYRTIFLHRAGTGTRVVRVVEGPATVAVETMVARVIVASTTLVTTVSIVILFVAVE